MNGDNYTRDTVLKRNIYLNNLRDHCIQMAQEEDGEQLLWINYALYLTEAIAKLEDKETEEKILLTFLNKED